MCDTVGERPFSDEHERRDKVKTVLFFAQDSAQGRCNLKRLADLCSRLQLQARTYNLIRWRGAGDVTLDLSSLPSDGVLDRITGDNGGA